MTTLTIHFGDALDHLRAMPDGSVDLIVTSPPYADARKGSYEGTRPDHYVEWFLPYAAELFRVLADDGSFVLNIKEKVVAGTRHTYVMRLVLALIDQGWLFTEEYMWHKKTTTPGKWPNRFRDLWEHVYHFTKQKKFTMNQEAVMVPIGDWAKKRFDNPSKNDSVRLDSATESGYGRRVANWEGREMVFPGNVLHFSSETSNVGHSAAYPLELPTWFVKLFSDPGDTVLDPFFGSGTTGIAALSLGRSAVGCELKPEFFDRSIERLREQKNEDIAAVLADPARFITTGR